MKYEQLGAKIIHDENEVLNLSDIVVQLGDIYRW